MPGMRRPAAPAPATRFAAPGAPPPAEVVPVEPEAMDAEGDPAALPEQAVIVIAVEGEQTADGRIVDAGALTWREPPLTLTVNHDPEDVAGRVSAIGRVASLAGLDCTTFAGQVGDAGAYVVGLVDFDLGYDTSGNLVDDEALGRTIARQVQGGYLLGISMEVGDEQIEMECTAWDEVEGFCEEYLMHLAVGRIGAITVAPFQAIEGARVIDVSDPAGTEVVEPVLVEEPTMVPEALAAALAGAEVAGPSWYVAPSPFDRSGALVAHAGAALFDLAGTEFAPPAEWFDDPHLDGPTPLTITADGQVYGHIALWGTCHIGRTDICLTPPHSATDYAYFRTGEVVCADGSRVPVGALTMNTGHADLTASAQDTVAHYDHTGTQAMHLAAGEDEHGIWTAGSLVHRDLTPQALTVVRAAAPSGDWRRIGGNLELVGVLAVNVPGFPVPRPRALAAAGQQLALVAAAAPVVSGAPCGCGGSTSTAHASVERRLEAVEAVVAALGLDAQAADAIAASLRP